MFRRLQLSTGSTSSTTAASIQIKAVSSLLFTKNAFINNFVEARRFQAAASASATTSTTDSTPAPTTIQTPKKKAPVTKPSSSINNVTLTGVIHDVQVGYVYETRVTQFVLTTTSIDTTSSTAAIGGGSASGGNNSSAASGSSSNGGGGVTDCVVEKDHHTIRCFGEPFADDIAARIKEGSVVCCSGRLRLNPQLEQSCGKHFYFPFVHVEPPFGSVAIVHGDHRRPPKLHSSSNNDSGSSSSSIPVAAATNTAATASTTTTTTAAPSDEAENGKEN